MHLNLDVNYGLPVGARTRTLLTLRFTLRLRTRTPLSILGVVCVCSRFILCAFYACMASTRCPVIMFMHYVMRLCDLRAKWRPAVRRKREMQILERKRS